jgi:GTP-sensing pleiotropic transcriptional regulator CodY
MVELLATAGKFKKAATTGIYVVGGTCTLGEVHSLGQSLDFEDTNQLISPFGSEVVGWQMRGSRLI